ncbi:MAG: trypsin-like peptidase domain-containing protein [Proteobacteria bacterium]|nr:trypsin-like peptidase domain-containing protein [Pseudomonadota bacterium]
MISTLFLLSALIWPGAASAQTMKVPNSQAEITLGFVPVVRQAAPAVVSIYTRKVVERRASPFAGDPFFERLFGNLFPGGPTRRRIENSLGSGVIVDASGIVVSNYHVVGGADQITVVLSDRREFEGRVILADKEADLAIVELVGAGGLPALELRDSDTLEVGELVLAIGNPFGVGQTVTSGIVSGLARSGAPGGRRQGYFIQTDAAINPGNSGGALVDMAGRLIGVNTSIISRSGGSNGIGFAVPSNLVARVIAAAREGADTLERPWLGLRTQPVTGELAEALGLTRPSGILVDQLHPQSAFARAGIETGDILLAIDGAELNTPGELAFRTATLGTGREAVVRYLRGGAEHEVSVALATAPDRPARDRTVLRSPRALRGLTVMNVNPAVIDQFRLPLASAGILVAAAGGRASRSGLRPGDLILAVDGRGVGDVDALEAALRRSGGFVLRIDRKGRRGNIEIGG